MQSSVLFALLILGLACTFACLSGRHRMRLTGLSTAIVLASTCVASAADLPVKYKAPPPALWSWSGLYGGVNAGYSFGRDSFSQELIDQGLTQQLPGRVLPTGAIFGGQLGYNWQ